VVGRLVTSFGLWTLDFGLFTFGESGVTSLITSFGCSATSLFFGFCNLDFGDGIKRYEASSGTHHHHFICTNCKGVSDINLKNELDTEERSLERIYNVTIKSHSLEFFGICSTCQGR
jgi:hypothetical protein